MEKPDLNRMWETFIRIGLSSETSFIERVYDTIRFKAYPLIADLKQKQIINWYCFLRHDRNSGVPTTEDANNQYVNIRVALKEDAKSEVFLESLPDYCVMTRKIERRRVEQISIGRGRMFDTSPLKSEEIEEVWRIIGEQSEWLINLLNKYKENVIIPVEHIGQFLHYYSNMTCLGIR